MYRHVGVLSNEFVTWMGELHSLPGANSQTTILGGIRCLKKRTTGKNEPKQQPKPPRKLPNPPPKPPRKQTTPPREQAPTTWGRAANTKAHDRLYSPPIALDPMEQR